MPENQLPHPTVVSKSEWIAARKALLIKEKEVTRHRDRVNAERRRLPMVEVEKEYLFEGPGGRLGLGDLFDGQCQLIIYHFMFDPTWNSGCDGCESYVAAIGDLSMLRERNTSFALVSRAELTKIEAYKALKGWSIPWYSSWGSDFNYDFHVTLDGAVAPVEYNYRSEQEIEAIGGHVPTGEEHGVSVFFRNADKIYHTYSTYARGTENLTDTYDLLDVTPYGRQEDWEDSPAGWPQKPTYG